MLALPAEKDKGMHLWSPNPREDTLKPPLKPNFAKSPYGPAPHCSRGSQEQSTTGFQVAGCHGCF